MITGQAIHKVSEMTRLPLRCEAASGAAMQGKALLIDSL
jgi:hypothetical protein